jgi:hypothetical protein
MKNEPNIAVHWVCRGCVAFAWIYHGLVPKIVARQVQEIAPLTKMGIAEPLAWNLVIAAGILEIAMGAVVLAFGQRSLPWLLTIAAMIGLGAGSVVVDPALATAAFNPVTLNLSIAACAFAALMTRPRVSMEPEASLGRGTDQ